MDARAHFLQLARYNVWATRRLLDAVANVSEADYRKDVGLFFKSIHGTLNHLLVGEHHIWFPRFAEGASPRLALNAELEADRQMPKGGQMLVGEKGILWDTSDYCQSPRLIAVCRIVCLGDVRTRC